MNAALLQILSTAPARRCHPWKNFARKRKRSGFTFPDTRSTFTPGSIRRSQHSPGRSKSARSRKPQKITPCESAGSSKTWKFASPKTMPIAENSRCFLSRRAGTNTGSFASRRITKITKISSRTVRKSCSTANCVSGNGRKNGACRSRAFRRWRSSSRACSKKLPSCSIPKKTSPNFSKNG